MGYGVQQNNTRNELVIPYAFGENHNFAIMRRQFYLFCQCLEGNCNNFEKPVKWHGCVNTGSVHEGKGVV